MSTIWYIRRGEKILGPFSDEVLVHLAGRGIARGSDEARREAHAWRPLSTVIEALRDEVRRRPLPSPGSVAEREEPSITGRYQRLALRRRERRGPLIAALCVVAAVIVLGAIHLTPAPVARDPVCGAPAAPGVVWRGCRKSGEDLVAARLSGASASGIDLRGARLVGARLDHADLRYADLRESVLHQADLRAASLVGADLRGADLSSADLGHADLAYADLTGARLAGADLAGARLDHAVWPDGRTCAAGSNGLCATP